MQWHTGDMKQSLLCEWLGGLARWHATARDPHGEKADTIFVSTADSIAEAAQVINSDYIVKWVKMEDWDKETGPCINI